MHLKSILLEAVRELDANGQEAVLEFPKQKFTLSVFRPEKKLQFVPMRGNNSIPPKLRTLIEMLKQHFNIQKVNSLDDEEDENDPYDDFLRGSFDVYVHPTEDFESVLSFIKNHIDSDLL